DLWFHVPTPGGEDEGGPALRWVERLKSFHHRPHPRDDVAAGTEFLTGELTELRQHQWVPRIRDDPFAMENAGLIYLNAPVHPDGQVTDDLVDESHSRNRLYPDAVLTGLLDQVPGDTDQPQRMSIKDQSDGPKALVVAVGLYDDFGYLPVHHGRFITAGVDNAEIVHVGLVGNLDRIVERSQVSDETTLGHNVVRLDSASFKAPNTETNEIDVGLGVRDPKILSGHPHTQTLLFGGLNLVLTNMNVWPAPDQWSRSA